MDYKTESSKKITEIIKKISIELGDEFGKNFERKAFFSKRWQEAKYIPGKKNGKEKGSLLDRTGKLRRSIRKEVSGDSIRFTSSVPYAAIHNEGGTIEINTTRIVTEKMKRFYWAMFFKTGDIMYKYAALKKVGSEIKIHAKVTIPQRQFIGDSPEVSAIIQRVFESELKGIEITIKNILKPKK